MSKARVSHYSFTRKFHEALEGMEPLSKLFPNQAHQDSWPRPEEDLLDRQPSSRRTVRRRLLLLRHRRRRLSWPLSRPRAEAADLARPVLVSRISWNVSLNWGLCCYKRGDGNIAQVRDFGFLLYFKLQFKARCKILVERNGVVSLQKSGTVLQVVQYSKSKSN